jgi:hypothetical protein
MTFNMSESNYDRLLTSIKDYVSTHLSTGDYDIYKSEDIHKLINKTKNYCIQYFSKYDVKNDNDINHCPDFKDDVKDHSNEEIIDIISRRAIFFNYKLHLSLTCTH